MTFPFPAPPIPLMLNLSAAGLSDDEQAVASDLSNRLWQDRPYLAQRELYYDGEQRVQQLGISVPPQMQRLHTVAGWPRLAVDVLDERLDVEGFIRPGANDSDDALWDIWTSNDMEQESQLAHLDALIFGRAYVMVGTGDSDVPLITVETPTNMSVHWDARTRKVVSGLQRYVMDGQECAALYLPDVTIHLVESGNGPWEVFDRDEHNLGETPVIMLSNRQRTHDRYGKSEITPEVMSITDAACRTLLGMEVAREFFAAPQRYILGASEEAFQDAEGNSKSAWETYIGRVLALERDEEGNLPTVGQFAAGDPTAYTGLLQMYSRFMAAITGLPPHLLGFSADNPASAEGIRSAESRLDKRALRKQRGFGNGWGDVLDLAATISGAAPSQEDSGKLSVLWADPSTPTIAETTNSMLQQVEAGFMPPTSKVMGRKLGYSAAELAQIEADRKEQQGQAALDEVAASLKSMRYRYTAQIRQDGGNAAAGADLNGADLNVKRPVGGP